MNGLSRMVVTQGTNDSFKGHCCLTSLCCFQGFVLTNPPGESKARILFQLISIFQNYYLAQKHISVSDGSPRIIIITSALDSKSLSGVIIRCRVSLLWTSDLLIFKGFE